MYFSVDKEVLYCQCSNFLGLGDSCRQQCSYYFTFFCVKKILLHHVPPSLLWLFDTLTPSWCVYVFFWHSLHIYTGSHHPASWCRFIVDTVPLYQYSPCSLISWLSIQCKNHVFIKLPFMLFLFVCHLSSLGWMFIAMKGVFWEVERGWSIKHVCCRIWRWYSEALKPRGARATYHS